MQVKFSNKLPRNEIRVFKLQQGRKKIQKGNKKMKIEIRVNKIIKRQNRRKWERIKICLFFNNDTDECFFHACYLSSYASVE